MTYFMAPGRVQINFSGHDVRWPDGRQLQRVGLTPDIEVRPTIVGIRAGRDEVLERADVLVIAAPHPEYRDLVTDKPVADLWGITGRGTRI